MERKRLKRQVVVLLKLNSVRRLPNEPLRDRKRDTLSELFGTSRPLALVSVSALPLPLRSVLPPPILDDRRHGPREKNRLAPMPECVVVKHASGVGKYVHGDTRR